jgi:long-chain fatty acid transport protein
METIMKTHFKAKLLPALLFGLFASPLWAAGFQLQNQNAAGTGLAFAGQAANPEDASTVFFNPAGMTFLPSGQNITMAGTVIDRSVKFRDTGTTPMPVINPLTGLPTGAFHPVGGNGGDAGGAKLVPGFYYTYSLNPQTVLGLGVSGTYGSETGYDSDFAGRFSGRFTSIHQININPSVAYKVNDQFSIGFGLNYAKNEVEFRQTTPYVGAPEAVLQGDDSAWGWNAGVMFKPNERTRIGLSYRSKMKFDLQGSLVVAALGVNKPIHAKLNTPDNLSLAFSHQVNDKLEVLGDVTRTGWATLQRLQAFNTSTGALENQLSYNFKNSWRAGVGVKYQLDGKWNLRAGVAVDKTPVPDAASRTMTVPDSDRTWLAFGARMKVSEKSSLDLGYARIFLKNSSTNRQVLSGTGVVLQTVRGDFKSSVNLFSAQYNMNF